MKNIYKFIFVIVITTVAFYKSANATHVAGADITYENVGVDSFLVTINIFDDCGSTANVGNTISVDFTNSCGLTPFSLNFNNISNTEVSQLCPSEQPFSTCNGGSLPGMLQRVYQRIVVLDSCDSWTITWGIANRNASVNLDPPGNTYYFAVDASINNAIAPTNNSPKFNSQPIPYVCANQLVNYSFGVSELDGDSLVYSFTDPLGGAQGAITTLSYQPGYTVQQPLPGINLDPLTGLLVFTPTVIGGFVVVVKVEEFQNGVLIGFVKRDIQFIVQSCTNNPPDILGGQITNLNGDAVLTDPYTLEMCEGNSFSFTAVFSDLDIADTLTATSNIATVLPGATFATSGTNPLSIDISWTAPAGSSGQNNSFVIATNDGACPIPGIQNYVYNILVVPSSFIIPSAATICLTDSLQLQAIGGADFNWYDINGVPVVVGPEFSCNNCPDPVIRPTITTSYIMVSNLSVTCINKDTIVVTVVPNYTISASATDTIVCSGETIQFDALSAGSAGPFTYSWVPANLFSNPIIANPSATFNNAGAFNAIVNVTSAQGCSRKDSISITVVNSPVFNIQPYGPYCRNGAFVNLDYTVPNPFYLENWVGQGIIDSLNGTFDPSSANIGSNLITLTLSVPSGSCSVTDSITIIVIAEPDPTLTISDTVFCSVDAPIQLGIQTVGGAWSSNPAGAISSDVFNPGTSPIGVVDLIYSFSGTCPDADTVSVIVNQTPNPPILSQNQIICTGTNLQEGAVTGNGISGGIISWFANDILQGLVDTGSVLEAEISATTTVYAYDSLNGCVSDVSSLLVNFNPTPTAQFTVDPADGTGTTPFIVNFTNGSTGFDEWQWSFGDNSSIDSTNFSVTHTYPEGGIFRVILTVSNDYGCADTLGFTVLALEELVIPNIFTPNGDGSNDEFYFKVDANSVKSFKATIFDRWGKKVTEFSSVKDKWDGGNFPAGTYYYIIEASDLNSQPFKHTHGFFKMMK